MKRQLQVSVILGSWLLLIPPGCRETQPELAPDIFGNMGDPLPSANAQERATFERGRALGLRRFTATTGLGPDFNVTFCLACHEKPTVGGSAPRYRNFLLVATRIEGGHFAFVGTNGVQPHFSVTGSPRKLTDVNGTIFATRHPIPFFGAGLLQEIPEQEILRRVDEKDADGDGISGRANYDTFLRVGRFGRKSQAAVVEGFVRGPLFNHMGITTKGLTPEQVARLPGLKPTPASGVTTRAQVAIDTDTPTDLDMAPDPEMSPEELFDLVSFTLLLAAPRPDPPTTASVQGRKEFARMGCEGCHVPALHGPRGLIPAYTDLLLHDMGPELADGTEFTLASVSEFRTQPLWGLSATGPYLHDGRADTIDQAIRAHAGEAAAARAAYERALGIDRDNVVAFLLGLGGSAQASEGLLPSGAASPLPGTPGGPTRPLGLPEAELFTQGRRIFDRDVPVFAGLGPFFNADSCRACHIDPVLGGSGPRDVDVIRHGFFAADTGIFQSPSIGTMAHRHALVAQRPPYDDAANLSEARQTPALFGLGLIDAIADDAILANADPMDDNADGISGRAHRLGDGRPGRFGWKASVPSLVEFVRDALSNEIGVTVPPFAGQTFGNTVDADGVLDPEISLGDFQALAFFLANLAPLPPISRAPVEEAAGGALFRQIGCSACHTPALPLPAGGLVPLYSDLLLHDVAPPGVPGVADGDAGPREFRTPPLWGVSHSAPYMHDGRSDSLTDAIAGHKQEGAASASAFAALSPAQQAQVLAFLAAI